MHKKQNRYDVIIAGAGPAGLCFAKSLADMGLKTVLVEKQARAALADPVYDGREIALTHLSRRIMEKLGVWSSMDVSLIRDAVVLNGTSPYALKFDHREAGRENLGFMISNQSIRKAAFAAADHENIHLLTETEVVDAGSDDVCAWVKLDNGKRLEAPLLVAADSRFSPTRKMMDVSVSMLEFKRTCIVCRMSHKKPHDKTAYECFHYDRTLAVLPLNGNHSSIVITLPDAEAKTVLSLKPEDFAQDIADRIDGRLGKMKLASKLYPYPLVGTYAENFTAKRFALIGDAAVGMHPVTAHGFNFGLRGQDTLAAEIKTALETGTDIGAESILRRYNARHRRATKPLYLGTNALVRLYTKTAPSAKLLRHALLVLGNKIRPAKKVIMGSLTEDS